ncbi:MAG: hypothetical protein F6K09_15985, partial [Merismopedia sp. SIO2A8]|nr:hypothetical protein [Merismopedia sp. SIO2A8]
MKHYKTFAIANLIVVLSSLGLSGCGFLAQQSSGDGSNTPVSENLPPSSVPDALPAQPTESIEGDPTPVPEDVQVYQDENGMFALALPPNYSYEPMEQGLTFLSEDGGFGGGILYQVSEEPAPSDLLDQEEALKAVIAPQFNQIEWQKSGQRQPDGSVRLAWTGIDEAGKKIDALSFIETHGLSTFVLSVYGIDQEYNNYSEDARIIVGTYVVRQGPITTESPSEDTSSENSEGDSVVIG